MVLFVRRNSPRALALLITLFAGRSTTFAATQEEHEPGRLIAVGGGPLRGTDSEASHSCLSTVDKELLAQTLAAVASSTAALGPVGLAQLPSIKAYPQAGRWYGDLHTLNFVDLDPTAGVRDWECEGWSYNGHDATDTVLRTFEEQAIGVPVYAAWDGVVVNRADGHPDMNTSWSGQPANFVAINHGPGRVAWYLHFKKNSVAVHVGDFVRAGQQIGLTGSSGNSSGPHLHFALYENGQLIEPFSGACQSTPSRWEQQRPKPHVAYLQDFGFTRQSLTNHNPVFGMPRTGQIALSDAIVRFWAFVPALPAQSTWSASFVRPNGTVAYNSAVYGFNNNGEYRWSWWWFEFNIADMHTIAGDWKVRLRVNGRQLIEAPVNVVGSVNPSFNRAPESIAVNFVPPNPSLDDVIHCRVETDLGMDDKDYDVLRYRYEWRVNGVVVRDVTTAALSDAIPVGTVALGDQLQCTVTPSDGTASATAAQVSRTIDCLASTNVNVPGRANLMSAGHAVPDSPGGGGFGYLPIEIPLSGLSGDVVTFPQVSGQISGGPQGWNGPDGGTLHGGVTDVTSFDGVAGLIHANRTMFLAGVFLNASEPIGAAPARLNVTAMNAATDIAPGLRQTFFIGDGRVGSSGGAFQRFHPPSGATRLCLGVVEAFGFVGSSGHYGDNAGVLAVSVAHTQLESCPCRAESYCVSTPNSTGNSATIAGLGLTSIAANDFKLTCAGAPPASQGLFFYGSIQANVPFANGVRCVANPSARLPLVLANAQGYVEQSLDLATPPALMGPTLLGASWNFQYWFRDSAGGGFGTDLSDGLAVTFCP